MTSHSDPISAQDRSQQDAQRAPATIGIDSVLRGVAPAMQRVRSQIDRVAPTDSTVLIVGESGTGKELAAHAVHRLSARSHHPFMAINCAAITPTLIETELFGHEKGSFTGATQVHRGYFERASGGTLFLDEVTEMAPAMQVRLLRVLETGVIQRIGGDQTIAVDVRILAATNRDAAAAVRHGDLREDLLYRLSAFTLTLPPLRNRGADIELLARHFIDEMNADHHSKKRLPQRSLDLLRTHTWPGNVRELRNTLYRAFILADSTIDINTDFFESSAGSTQSESTIELNIGTPLACAQRALILGTLQQCSGDKQRAAKMLGISLKTLYNRLDLYREAAQSPT